jgi:hypothetical protein
MDTEPSFTGLQVAEVQLNLRDALGLPPRHFSLRDFIGMISDEIQQFRDAGKSDTQIVNLIKVAVAIAVPVESIALYFDASKVGGSTN